MSLLDYLVRNFGRTSTICTELYLTTTSVQDANGNIDNAGITTIATSVTSALDDIIIPDAYAEMNDAVSYVESLSEDELVRFNQLLEENNLVIESECTDDKPMTLSKKI